MSISLVSNQKIAEKSSKGNQEKWYDVDSNSWYKLDQFGYEALAAPVISQLLEQSNIERDTPFTFLFYRFIVIVYSFKSSLQRNLFKFTLPYQRKNS